MGAGDIRLYHPDSPWRELVRRARWDTRLEFSGGVFSRDTPSYLSVAPVIFRTDVRIDYAYHKRL